MSLCSTFFILILSLIINLVLSINFQCGGSNSSKGAIDCVGDNIECNDTENCNIDCYDGFGDAEPGLCGISDPGCCDSFVECGVNGICEIKCSYSCRNMIINATLSKSLIIKECSGYSCTNITIYCPNNDINNSCKLQSDSIDLLSNLKIYNNINITYNGLISGTLHCNDNSNQCVMDTLNPSLCEGLIPLICNNTNDIEAVLTVQNENKLFIEMIAIMIGILMIMSICLFILNRKPKHAENDSIKSEIIKPKTDDIDTKTDDTQDSMDCIVSTNNNDDNNNNDDDDNNDQLKEYQNRINHFKSSLSTQIKNDEKLMDDVIKEIRRNSQYRDILSDTETNIINQTPKAISSDTV